jgi:hypothetical protein
MFYLDDLVMSPFKGFMFIVKEIAKAVEQERESQRNNTMAELSALHAKLEAGEIDEDTFDELEAELLDRLEDED